jgi:RasGEF domain
MSTKKSKKAAAADAESTSNIEDARAANFKRFATAVMTAAGTGSNNNKRDGNTTGTGAISVFLTSYRLMCTADDLVAIWRRAFWHVRKDDAKRDACLAFLEAWLREFPADFSKSKLAELLDIVQKRAPGDVFNRLKLASIRSAKTRGVARGLKMKESDRTGLDGQKESDGETARDVLLTMDPEDVAETLSAAEWRLLAQVGVDELVVTAFKIEQQDGNSNSKQEQQNARSTAHLTRMADHFNEISFWVATEILVRSSDNKERKKVMERVIAVANACKDMRNFNSMMALLAGLNHVAGSFSLCVFFHVFYDVRRPLF